MKKKRRKNPLRDKISIMDKEELGEAVGYLAFGNVGMTFLKTLGIKPTDVLATLKKIGEKKPE